MNKEIHLVYLQLGSNLGDIVSYLTQAKKYIAIEVGKILKTSNLYESESWGVIDQPEYINEIIKIETELNPEALLLNILDIEKRIGRKREYKWSARVIDIDIIFYNNIIINNTNLTIPHKHMHERNFVLFPLNEIASEYVHPILNKKVKELLCSCRDLTKIEKYEL